MMISAGFFPERKWDADLKVPSPLKSTKRPLKYWKSIRGREVFALFWFFGIHPLLRKRSCSIIMILHNTPPPSMSPPTSGVGYLRLWLFLFFWGKFRSDLIYFVWSFLAEFDYRNWWSFFIVFHFCCVWPLLVIFGQFWLHLIVHGKPARVVKSLKEC